MTIQWTPEMEAALIEARAKGIGYNAAGELVGVSNHTARKRVVALGLPTWGRNGGRRKAKQ